MKDNKLTHDLLAFLTEPSARPFTRSDLSAFSGIDGEGFIAEIGDITRILDVTPDDIAVQDFDANGDLIESTLAANYGQADVVTLFLQNKAVTR